MMEFPFYVKIVVFNVKRVVAKIIAWLVEEIEGLGSMQFLFRIALVKMVKKKN